MISVVEVMAMLGVMRSAGAGVIMGSSVAMKLSVAAWSGVEVCCGSIVAAGCGSPVAVTFFASFLMSLRDLLDCEPPVSSLPAGCLVSGIYLSGPSSWLDSYIS